MNPYNCRRAGRFKAPSCPTRGASLGARIGVSPARMKLVAVSTGRGAATGQRNMAAHRLLSGQLAVTVSRAAIGTMRIIVTTAVIALLAGSAAAQTCTTLGIVTTCNNGLHAYQYGSTTQFNDGTRAYRSGNRTFYSNGVTAYQYGDTTHFSNGLTARHYGNTTVFSNGRRCTHYAGMLSCY